jgi:hypothetical protein
MPGGYRVIISAAIRRSGDPADGFGRGDLRVLGEVGVAGLEGLGHPPWAQADSRAERSSASAARG